MDGALHPARKLFKELDSIDSRVWAFVNESPSAFEQEKRAKIVKEGEKGPVPGYTSAGRSIIRATLFAMVWLGLVQMDGDGEHAAYRLVAVDDDAPARPAAAESQEGHIND